MRIEVLYFEGCPNYVPTIDRLRTVLREEGMNVEVLEVEVKNAAAAERLRFIGSPTIRINELDMEAAAPPWPEWASPRVSLRCAASRRRTWTTSRKSSTRRRMRRRCCCYCHRLEQYVCRGPLQPRKLCKSLGVSRCARSLCRSRWFRPIGCRHLPSR